MKRLIIKNLKLCFEHKLTFTELARFEKKIFETDVIVKKVEIPPYVLTFKHAKISESQEIVLYYEFSHMPF